MKNSTKYPLIIYLLFFVGNGYVYNASAQDKDPRPFGHVFLFEMLSRDKKAMVIEPLVANVSDTALYRIFDQFKEDSATGTVTTAKSPLILAVKLNPSLVNYFSTVVHSISHEYPSYLISDSSDAVLIAMGINHKNAADFRYHVVENDSTELVPWSPVPTLAQHYGARQPYGFLGKYNAPGKRIMVEVVNAKNYSIRDGVVFDWRSDYKPVMRQLIVSGSGRYFNLAYTQLNHGYATIFDRATGVPLDFQFPADSVKSLLFEFKKQETLLHTVFLIKTVNGNSDTSNQGFVDQHGAFYLGSNNFSKPGHYQLVIMQQEKYFSWNEARLLRIPFDVLPVSSSQQNISFKQLWPYIAGIFFFFIVLFAGTRYYAKRKLYKAERQRTAAQLQLKTIRSQLNPHFMFNALSSIQNLMNKNDLLNANRYLSKFAGLTRKVLHTSEQEMISLEEEIKIAEDYLQLEQLRFGFEYKLEIAAGLDQANIEIPAMLLQPFIENAVKHGIAGLQERGLITITASRQENTLVLSVADNGNGFDVERKNEMGASFGLRLSRERINLFNQVYKGPPVLLQAESSTNGTLITITLNNWI